MQCGCHQKARIYFCIILKIVSMAFADLHRYRQKVYVVQTQELSAVQMSALQTQQQKEMLEEYFKYFKTALEHVLALAVWNTGL